MANLMFNCGKGRVVEIYKNIKSGLHANGAFILVPLTAKPADGTLIDQATLAAVLAGGSTEQTTIGRKTVNAAALAALPAADNTNDRYDVSMPTVTYTTPSGTAVVGFVVCVDYDTTAGTDSNIEPLSYFDFPFTPSGIDVQITGAAFFRAS